MNRRTFIAFALKGPAIVAAAAVAGSAVAAARIAPSAPNVVRWVRHTSKYGLTDGSRWGTTCLHVGDQIRAVRRWPIDR